MNRLLVDNSNTRTKFALVSGDGVLERRVLQTADVCMENVKAVLQGWHFTEVGICSVVPDAAVSIAEACKPANVSFLTPYISSLGVDFLSYEGIETLGADRVANALAAANMGEFPVVAVDLGTATTFDVVVRQGDIVSFAGGAIAPGMTAFAHSLNHRTALLPGVSSTERGPVIASTTQSAMAAAVRVGYPAMIDGILDEMERELGEQLHVVLTGGDATAIAPRLRHHCQIEPLLTLRGIGLAFGLKV